MFKVVALNSTCLVEETPQQNGVVKRKHQHIVEIGLIMSFHTNRTLSLWVEVFSMTLYLINRLPSLVLQNESPYKKLYKRHPNYTGLWVL